MALYSALERDLHSVLVRHCYRIPQDNGKIQILIIVTDRFKTKPAIDLPFPYDALVSVPPMPAGFWLHKKQASQALKSHSLAKQQFADSFDLAVETLLMKKNAGLLVTLLARLDNPNIIKFSFSELEKEISKSNLPPHLKRVFTD
jgi:hypothetical protein